MERTYLEQRIGQGWSLEAIGQEAGCHLSTVAYWLKKFGLQAARSDEFAQKGPISAGDLEPLVADGLSVRQIAQRIDRGVSSVRYWMRRYGLRTQQAELRATPRERRARVIERRCSTHGLTAFVMTGSGEHYRCARCRSERVIRRRRHIKATLVREAGGSCQLCGYDRWDGALQFHHLDPENKEFHIARRGVSRSLDRARAEASKCVLLCANCHAEVEGGLVTVSIE